MRQTLQGLDRISEAQARMRAAGRHGALRLIFFGFRPWEKFVSVSCFWRLLSNHRPLGFGRCSHALIPNEMTKIYFARVEFRRLVKFKIRKSKLLPVIDHRIGILNQLHVWGAVTYHQRHTWLNNLVSATPPCALNSFDTWDENMAIDLQHDIPK